jgi:hypothetical protein
VSPVRLKSSFIYLANAVNDLRGNWPVLAVMLAPLVLAAALCFLPDALNLQHLVATSSVPGSQNIAYTQVDNVDTPAKPPPLQEAQPFAPWVTTVLHILFVLLTLLVTLVTLCSLKRIQADMREPTIVGEAIEVYRSAIRLAPGFIWVTFLQLAVPVTAAILLRETRGYQLEMLVYLVLVLMMILGALLYAWLYFAQYALIFDGKHSFHALLFSRDLIRKRFFKVATRIVVFLAMWSGFNWWTGVAFYALSLLLGPVVEVTGSLVTTLFLFDFAGFAVNFATIAFVVAAGLRLYQDLKEREGEVVGVNSAEQVAMQATAELPRIAL